MADKMTRCPEGHFFDAAKHNACPWCALPQDSGSEQKTRPVAPPPLPQPAAPPPIPAGPKPGATVRLGMPAAELRGDPVVGWLVCVEGPDRGKDYRLHSEKNFVGRST